MAKVVFALVDDIDHADRIVIELQKAGFNTTEISVLFSDDAEANLLGSYEEDIEDGIATAHFKNKKGTLGTEKHTKAPEGGAAGAAAGGIIGGSLGLLAGIGTLAIPGMGAFIAAGPLMAALSGSAVGGAVGLLIGTLAGLGIPEYEAKKYQSELEQGHVLISVHAQNLDLVEEAKNVLEEAGAKHISTSSEKAGSKW